MGCSVDRFLFEHAAFYGSVCACLRASRDAAVEPNLLEAPGDVGGIEEREEGRTEAQTHQ